MDEIISYKMCAVKVRNAKLRNYLNLKNKMFDFARVKPLFSRGLNSKYLTPVMYFELSPHRKWAWHGCGRGLTRKGVVGA